MFSVSKTTQSVASLAFPSLSFSVARNDLFALMAYLVATRRSLRISLLAMRLREPTVITLDALVAAGIQRLVGDSRNHARICRSHLAMIVCSCNVLSDDQVRTVTRTVSRRTPMGCSTAALEQSGGPADSPSGRFWPGVDYPAISANRGDVRRLGA
jgi:hypothetical protein